MECSPNLTNSHYCWRIPISGPSAATDSGAALQSPLPGLWLTENPAIASSGLQCGPWPALGPSMEELWPDGGSECRGREDSERPTRYH